MIHQLGWVEVQETVVINDLDRRPDSNLATHLAIDDSRSNLIHEFRHDLGIFVASRVTRILDAIRYVP